MNISSTTVVQSATADASAPTSDALNLTILKKALNAQEASAAALIQALPEPPPLATEGSLGTQVNTYA